MEKLEKLFIDVGRIADAMEERNKILTKLEKVIPEDKVCECCKDTTVAEIPQDVTQAVQAVQPVQNIPAPVQAPVAPAAIPTTNTVQTYTQEQLSVAMARGVDNGLMEQIQSVMSSFGVSCLMQLAPENYGALALKLKEIGVDV